MAALWAAACGFVGFGVVQLGQQLLDADFGVFDQRLHGVHILQRGVQVYGVVDAKHGFANAITPARGAANHLLVQDA